MTATHAPDLGRGPGQRTRTRPAALVVGPLPPPAHGGSVATRLLLDSRLAERFRLVHVDTTDRRGIENIGRFELGNVRLAWLHFRRFRALLRSERPALAYVPVAQSRLAFLRDALFLLPARARGTAVVVHFHCGGFRGFYERTDPVTRAVVRASLRNVRAIVLGEGLKDMLADVVPADRVAVIPNGIPDPYDGELRREPAPPAGAGRVLFLATIRKEKGVYDLLAAARLLAADRRSLRYTIAGAFLQSHDRVRTEAMVADGLADQVRTVGVVEGAEKAALYRTSDIFVFPPNADEGHPYVILEAMAAGLAIITTPRGAIPETIVDGETGMIVPAGDPRALADAIRRLADDPPLRARLGAAARRRFLERYTFEAWSAAMAAALEASLPTQEPAWRA